MTWKARKERSNEIFENVVWPIVRTYCGDGEIYATDGPQGTILHLLDAKAGIDYFQQLPSGGFTGIAARVEDKGRNYHTFTIRYPSEWTGRTRDIAALNYYPHWWVHAYTDGDKFQSAAIIRTQELFDYAHKLHKIMKQHAGQKFYSIPWEEFPSAIVIGESAPL
ncbi:hypothetical protein [Anatilimnocola floriformis]|uniref:hypothetical protein n=1 Tax=Anatilimnocola floriformis TaxID=2948575 RepID=UPI0020C3A5C3|nr:hypothetical protein [Anatilimnocola floriformis]